MIPNITRGGNAAGVVYYLLGPGRGNEHQDAHLVAGSPELQLMVGEGVLDTSEARPIGRFLDEPRHAFGTEVRIAERDQTGQVVGSRAAHVWHCSLSLHPEEAPLSDETWRQITDSFIAKMGFAGEEQPRQHRWVAIRHGLSKGGGDHVHLVVGLVAEDGSKGRVHNDRPRAQRAARELEQTFGLRRLEAQTAGAGTRTTRPAERKADERRGRHHGEDRSRSHLGTRETLERVVRACATSAQTESAFVRALREQGVLTRPRYGTGGRREVVGYTVRLPGPKDGAERTIEYGGGRLARDLTLPALRQQWQQSSEDQQAAVGEWGTWTASRPRTSEERRSEHDAEAPSWQHCVAEIDRLRRQLRGVDGDPAGAARVAAEGAGMLAAWSLAVEGEQPGPLAQAARHLGRSAERPAHRRTPPARRRPRSSLLAAYLLAGAQPDSAAGWYLLGRQMALLGSDLARLHQTRGQLQRAEELERGLNTALERVRVSAAAGTSASATTDPQTTEQSRRLRDPTRPSVRSEVDTSDTDEARRLNDTTRRRPRRGR